jgi:hypothetical protein
MLRVCLILLAIRVPPFRSSGANRDRSSRARHSGGSVAGSPDISATEDKEKLAGVSARNRWLQ